MENYPSSVRGLPEILLCAVLAIQRPRVNRMAFLRPIELCIPAPSLAPDG